MAVGVTSDPCDTYMRYHATWTAIDGLRDYGWRTGLSFPDLKPLLTRFRSRQAIFRCLWAKVEPDHAAYKDGNSAS